MRNYKSKGGEFSERPYYENTEIDRICSEALDSVGLLPCTPQPIRIDRFIEKRLNVSVEYEDLEPGILGLTKFGKSGVKEVIVARALEEEGTLTGERRVRSTLAHEAGHGLLHAHLFLLTGQCGLFPDGNTTAPKVLCRDEGDPQFAKRYDGKWWEYQANRAIGGFLLPRELVMKSLAGFMIPKGSLGMLELDSSRKREADTHLAEVFDVNPIVASIRLNDLCPIDLAGQQLL